MFPRKYLLQILEIGTEPEVVDHLLGSHKEIEFCKNK